MDNTARAFDPPGKQVKDPRAGQPAGRPGHRPPRSKIHGLARKVFENLFSQAVGGTKFKAIS